MGDETSRAGPILGRGSTERACCCCCCPGKRQKNAGPFYFSCLPLQRGKVPSSAIHVWERESRTENRARRVTHTEAEAAAAQQGSGKLGLCRPSPVSAESGPTEVALVSGNGGMSQSWGERMGIRKVVLRLLPCRLRRVLQVLARCRQCCQNME